MTVGERKAAPPAPAVAAAAEEMEEQEKRGEEQGEKQVDDGEEKGHAPSAVAAAAEAAAEAPREEQEEGPVPAAGLADRLGDEQEKEEDREEADTSSSALSSPSPSSSSDDLLSSVASSFSLSESIAASASASSTTAAVMAPEARDEIAPPPPPFLASAAEAEAEVMEPLPSVAEAEAMERAAREAAVPEPTTWWGKQWRSVVRGTSFDPAEEGRRRSIFGFYQKEQEEAPDLPFLPYGDPPEDAELPVFSAQDFGNTSWTVGVFWEGGNPFRRVDRTRVFFRDDGRAVWLRGGDKGEWSYDARANVFRFGRETSLSLNGRRSFPTLLTEERSKYYMEGFVIGWAPFTPLCVYGLWQAYRDDVSDEERGPAPWDEREEQEQDRGVVKG